MAERGWMTVLQRMRRLAAEVGGASDAQLLTRFVAERDAAAFELLVWRHARLVFGVCRRVLHDLHDAEDAFQATFLTLARRADRIGRGEAVAAWLYRVAYRAALSAREARNRRTHRERPLTFDTPAPSDADAAERADLRAVLDEEISRLPDRWRAPLVLCYLEGKTVDEAAARLGCPRGTVASRLARAKQRLRTRLTRRGLAPDTLPSPLGGEGPGVRGPTPPFSLIPSLIPAALKSAAGGAAAVSPRVAALTEEVVKAMVVHKIKTNAVLLLTCTGLLLAGGVGVRLRAGGRPDEPAPAQTAPAAEKKPPAPADEAKRVNVRHPVRRELAPYEEFNGRLEAIRTVEVRAPVSGRLEKCTFPDGGEVKKGQQLFAIDPRPFLANVDKAKAELEVAMVRQKQTDADLKRVERLQRQAVVSPEEVTKATNDAAAAEANTRVARAALEGAQLTLDSTRVLAAADGRISWPKVDAGNLISANVTVLATITTINPIGVAFDVDEWSYLRYRRLPADQQVKEIRVGVVGEEDFPHAGKLVSIEDHVDAKTGMVRVRGAFPNTDPLLLPGMSAQVRLTFGKPRPMLLVSINSIRTDQAGNHVLVVNKQDRIERRSVALGKAVDADLRIVESGLRPDDWVVINNTVPLQAGDKVMPEKE